MIMFNDQVQLQCITDIIMTQNSRNKQPDKTDLLSLLKRNALPIDTQ